MPTQYGATTQQENKTKTIEKIKKYCIRAISKKKNKIQNTHPIQVTKNHEVQGNKKTRTMQTSIQDKKEIIT